jgi:mannose-6-phosphate isomerase class I
MASKELFFFKPFYKKVVWGGNKMRDVFGYDIPYENTGECWAISANDNGESFCVSPAEYAGKSLKWLWEHERHIFGDIPGDRFPLLLKVIDAKEDLSISLHPDDEYARTHENGSFGKTECWYILDCDEDSTIVLGHNARTREELCDLIDNKEYKKLIHEVPVHKGDFISVEPGTIHSIKKGILILEIQQNSDISYRVYDYDRLQDGKLRPLHVKECKEIINIPDKGGVIAATSNEPGVFNLVSNKYFKVKKVNVEGAISISEGSFFSMVSVIEGKGTLNGTEIKKGDHFIVPADFGAIDIEGDMTLMVSSPVV